MVDSGTAVSAIPPTSADCQRHNSGFTLQAVNQTSIKTYGKCMLKLDLGLRRSFSHMFVAADELQVKAMLSALYNKEKPSN